jgi:hypothetical protein
VRLNRCGAVDDGAHLVDAREQAAHLHEARVVELLERAAAHLGKDGEPDPVVGAGERGAAGERQGGDRRDLGVHQLGEKAVLVEDRLPGPAAGAVELGDHAGLVLQLDLVDPVLHAVELEGAAGGARAERGLDGAEHALGREGEELLHRLFVTRPAASDIVGE